MTTATDRVLIVLTSHDTLGSTGRTTGFYLPEVAQPWRVFTDAGIGVDLVSVAGGQPPMDGVDENDPVQAAFLADPDMSAALADTARPEAVDPVRYRAVLFAGGHGSMWDFPDEQRLAQIGREVYERGGVVSAVCHGPAGLVNLTLSDGAHLVTGKRVAAFTNAEEAAVGLTDVVPFLLSDRLAERGAHLVPGSTFEATVVIDGRLITGQNPASAVGVARAVVEALRALPSP